MAQAHTIEILIGEDGKLSSEIKGVEGQDCTDITKWLDSLGTVEVDKKTSDFYKTPKQTVKVKK